VAVSHQPVVKATIRRHSNLHIKEKASRRRSGAVTPSTNIDRALLNAKAGQIVRGLPENELEETFARSSGPGGQNVNKVATAVTLRHRPTGLSVTVQDSRSQMRNRRLARERLLMAIEQRTAEVLEAKHAALSKIRRRNSPRPPRLKRRILETKRKRSQLKKLRAKPID
jgi:peptide chain release factor